MIRKLLTKIVIFFLASSFGAVFLGKFLPIYYTPLMFVRLAEQCADDRPMKLSHQWVPMEEISRNVPLSVMASDFILFFFFYFFFFYLFLFIFCSFFFFMFDYF